MWQHGDIMRELGWTILFLIHKGNMGTREIGLLELMWKVVEAIINTHLSLSVRLHDFLNGFRSGRGMGTEILEMNMAQELASVDQDSLFLVFLDL